MLDSRYRATLVATVMGVFPRMESCRTFVDSVRADAWNATVPPTVPYADAVSALVVAADGQGWLRVFVERLSKKFEQRTELSDVLAEIDRAATPKTDANPFEEVLLEGGRPFVNRKPLRAHLVDLLSRQGASVLRVDGEPQTGKSYSYYLINHVAPARGFEVHKFKMSSLPTPDELAFDILDRIGVDASIPPLGQESAERWAEKIANALQRAIRESGTARLFVFDDFSTTPLPEGTQSLIVRLATYADEELHPFLRVVLVRFPGTLPPEVEDITPLDIAQPFTPTDEVAVVMKVGAARKWSISEGAVKAKIDEYQQSAGRTLNERFKFLRQLLQQLDAHAE